MMSYFFYGDSLRFILLFMGIVWLFSLSKKKYEWASPSWGPAIMISALSCFYSSWGLPTFLGQGEIILTAMIFLWSLSFVLSPLRIPFSTKTEEKLRSKDYWWFSFFKIFMLQSFMIWILTLPFQWYFLFNPSHQFNLLGLILMIMALFLEIIALVSLKNPRLVLLSKGLFPWGLFLFIQSYDFFPPTLLSPLLLTGLLLKKAKKQKSKKVKRS